VGIDPNQLLRSLGSGTGVSLAARPQSKPTSLDVSQSSFSELLQAASSGEMESGAPVTLAKGLKLELSAAQMKKLATAADRAQAQGAHRAVVLMDGKALELDVATRTITGEVKGAPGGKLPRVLDGVDTIVAVPGENEALENASPFSGLGGASNASLLNLLASRQTQAGNDDSSDSLVA